MKFIKILCLIVLGAILMGGAMVVGSRIEIGSSGGAETESESTFLTAGEWTYLGSVPRATSLDDVPYPVGSRFDRMMDGGIFAYNVGFSADYGDGILKIVCDETLADGTVNEGVVLFKKVFQTGAMDGSYEYNEGSFVGQFEILAPEEGVTRSNLRMYAMDDATIQVYAFVG